MNKRTGVKSSNLTADLEKGRRHVLEGSWAKSGHTKLWFMLNQNEPSLILVMLSYGLVLYLDQQTESSENLDHTLAL